ncbi:MAG TPA: GNAT family N-acetyltransferase [Trebonia sp.]
MRIAAMDAFDQAATQACFEVVRAADETDDPLGPPWSLRRLRSWLQYPADPAETWVCRDETSGAVRGWYYLGLPGRENRERAYLNVAVHPAARRRGTGSALLRHAAGRAAANRHMIAINEELGYELLGPLTQNYRLAVAGWAG